MNSIKEEQWRDKDVVFAREEMLKYQYEQACDVL